jgi:hypothetical protein
VYAAILNHALVASHVASRDAKRDGGFENAIKYISKVQLGGLMVLHRQKDGQFCIGQQ